MAPGPQPQVPPRSNQIPPGQYQPVNTHPGQYQQQPQPGQYQPQPGQPVIYQVGNSQPVNNAPYPVANNSDLPPTYNDVVHSNMYPSLQ